MYTKFTLKSLNCYSIIISTTQYTYYNILRNLKKQEINDKII